VTVTAVPAPADPEIAAAVFADHAARVSGSSQARARGWAFTGFDPMHVIVTVTGTRPDGQRDVYYLKLGAEYYDRYPPTTSFVCPPRPATGNVPRRDGWTEAPAESRWLPNVSLEWFAIHSGYPNFADGIARQLVCCSMTFEYYITGHGPTSGQQWRQGRHTLAATLNRVHDAVNSPNYQGPAGADDP
jgi:hypothetical protein